MTSRIQDSIFHIKKKIDGFKFESEIFKNVFGYLTVISFIDFELKCHMNKRTICIQGRLNKRHVTYQNLSQMSKSKM